MVAIGRIANPCNFMDIIPKTSHKLFGQLDFPKGKAKQKLQATLLLLMEEILNNHLGCIKPGKQWDKLHINWCRISSTVSCSYFIIIYFIVLLIAWFVLPRLQLDVLPEKDFSGLEHVLMEVWKATFPFFSWAVCRWTMLSEPRKKKPPTFHYTGWLIGILIINGLLQSL